MLPGATNLAFLGSHPSLAFEDNMLVSTNEFMLRARGPSIATMNVLVKHMGNL